ncbi:MAG: BsuPI-related putative proteinase inhibitor [archaeon YNP-LCB-024-027]|jgi:hypothetical protein|nr:BsuPI-related putative proteinase inhibitor [Candidatus Culexarchaeum yellowstonense]
MKYRLLVMILLVAGLLVAGSYAYVVQPIRKTITETGILDVKNASDLSIIHQSITENTPTNNIETYKQATNNIQQILTEPILLTIVVDGVEFAPGSTLRLTAQIQNTGLEDVLLEYFTGQLFEVIIRDEAGTPLYVHSDTGFHKYLLAAPLHLRLAPGESYSQLIEVKLIHTRGAEKGSPLPPGIYTLTVYLTAAVEKHPSKTINGLKAYTSVSTTITIKP